MWWTILLRLLLGSSALLILGALIVRLLNSFSGGWTFEDMRSQKGKSVLVTGCTVGGLGYQTCLDLAKKGATVIMTSRNMKTGEVALKALKEAVPTAQASLFPAPLDLASTKSILAFCSAFQKEYDALDVLVNNAGIMAVPERRETVDGLELQWGVNYFGPWLLTRSLLPLLARAGQGGGEPSRVVTLGSFMAYPFIFGRLHLDDLQWKTRRYQLPGVNSMFPYGQSKLCCLLKARQLNQICREKKYNVISIAAHPGWSKTNLMSNNLTKSQPLMGPVNALLGQEVAMGTLPTLYAIDRAPADTLVGPRFVSCGPPKVEAWAVNTRNPKTWQALENKSEEILASLQ